MTANTQRSDALRRVIRAAVHGDARDVTDLFTDDVRAWTPALTASSAAELFEQLNARDDVFSDITLDTFPLDVGGRYASVEWTVTMTHTGTLKVRDGETVEATGLRVSLHGVAVAEFEGARICALRQYWDELSLFEQLGLLAAPA